MGDVEKKMKVARWVIEFSILGQCNPYNGPNSKDIWVSFEFSAIFF
jgi:hypothetical protein